MHFNFDQHRNLEALFSHHLYQRFLEFLFLFYIHFLYIYGINYKIKSNLSI